MPPDPRNHRISPDGGARPGVPGQHCGIEAHDSTPPLSIRARLVSGAGWSLVGMLVARGSILLAMIVVARLLGERVYGQLGILQATLGMVAELAALRTGAIGTKYVAQLRRRDPERAGRIIALAMVLAIVFSIVVALGLVLCGPWISSDLLDAPQLATPLAIGSVYLVLSTYNCAQTGVLAGLEAFRQLSLTSAIGGLVGAPLAIAGAIGWGVAGTIGGLSLGMLLQIAIAQVVLGRQLRRAGLVVRWRQWQREWRVLWTFGLPATLAVLIVGPVNWAGSVLLIHQADGYTQMGAFHIANQWFTMLVFLPGMLARAYLPVATEVASLQGMRRLKQVLIKAIGLNLALVTPLVLVTCAASPLLMRIYGGEFSDAWPALVLTAITATVVSAQTPIAQTLAALGRMWICLAMNLAWAVCWLSLAWVSVEWGATGLALARLLAYAAHMLWTGTFVFLLARGATAAAQDVESPQDATADMPLAA